VLQVGETAIFHVSRDGVLLADQNTKLESIGRFQEFGVFLGKDSVKLTLYAAGAENPVDIWVNRSDTIADLVGKISLAMNNPARTDDLNLDNAILASKLPNLVHFNVNGSAAGTISMTVPIPGLKVYFAGDENLIKALSWYETAEAKNPVYSVVAHDIHTGELVGSVKTTDNVIRGLLPGVHMIFDRAADMLLNNGNPNSFWKPLEKPTISVNSVHDTEFIHVAPNPLYFHIGANEMQVLGTAISDMGADALGVTGLVVVDQDAAEEAITKIDVALTKVADERAKLGAIQNRLESTIRNLDVAHENLSAADSRIRDANLAKETVDFAREQILIQSGIAVLSQATTLPQTVLRLLR